MCEQSDLAEATFCSYAVWNYSRSRAFRLLSCTSVWSWTKFLSFKRLHNGSYIFIQIKCTSMGQHSQSLPVDFKQIWVLSWRPTSLQTGGDCIINDLHFLPRMTDANREVDFQLGSRWAQNQCSVSWWLSCWNSARTSMTWLQMQSVDKIRCVQLPSVESPDSYPHPHGLLQLI